MAKHEAGTMRKLIVSNATSLDGYYTGPDEPRDAAAGAVTPLPSSA
jgi:hypothetical protein